MRRAALGATIGILLAGTLLAAIQTCAAPGGPRGFRQVVGRVAAKGENTLSVEVRRPGGAGAAVTKVILNDETKYSRFEPGKMADLEEGYLVSVLGQRQENKVTAQAVLRLSKVEGEVKPEHLRGLLPATMYVARELGIQMWRPGQGIDATRRPVVGKIISTQPLTVETVTFRPQEASEKVEVQAQDGTKVLLLAGAKLDDVVQDVSVAVTPKEENPGEEVTALMVTILPKLAQGDGDQAK